MSRGMTGTGIESEDGRNRRYAMLLWVSPQWSMTGYNQRLWYMASRVCATGRNVPFIGKRIGHCVPVVGFFLVLFIK